MNRLLTLESPRRTETSGEHRKKKRALRTATGALLVAASIAGCGPKHVEAERAVGISQESPATATKSPKEKFTKPTDGARISIETRNKAFNVCEEHPEPPYGSLDEHTEFACGTEGETAAVTIQQEQGTGYVIEIYSHNKAFMFGLGAKCIGRTLRPEAYNGHPRPVNQPAFPDEPNRPGCEDGKYTIEDSKKNADDFINQIS